MGDQGKPGDAAAALRERLAPVAAQMGVRVELPDGDSDVARIAPRVNLGWSIGKRLGRELGQLVANCGIFRYGDRIVTVDELTGRVQTMSSRRLGSWLEKWVETYKTDRYGNENATTMGDQLAKQVLEADQFRDALLELRAVNPVRMPVLRPGAGPELLRPGYDVASGIYTCHGISYNTKMTIEEAREVFAKELRGFPFADIGPDGRGLFNNRSVAVQVCMMLGNYCRGFFEPGVVRPMSLLLGNQPGTGKGMLAQMQLSAIWGLVKLGRKPKDDAEFEKRLDTSAIALSPYLVLDDIGGGLFSNALNAWITEPIHNGRTFSTQEEFSAPNVTQVIATGNQIKLTRDLDRRSLIVELHEAGEVEGKRYDHVIDSFYLARHDVRARMLAAMWAMVRHWGEGGCFEAEQGKPTFEKWTTLMAGLTRTAGFDDPLQKPELGAGGDEETSAWKEFLARVAGEGVMPGESGRMFTVREMLELARTWEAEDGSTFSLDDLVGSAKDANKAFGHAIRKWKAREITDTLGRRIQFGQRREATRRGYTCEVLHDPAAVPAEG
jgi:hypothetical protein